jgi:hypothetical protein
MPVNNPLLTLAGMIFKESIMKEMVKAAAPEATLSPIYCGRCYHDRGQYVKLFGPFFTNRHETVFHCGFCNEERHPGGSHLRVTIVKTEEIDFRIPHLVTLGGSVWPPVASS